MKNEVLTFECGISICIDQVICVLENLDVAEYFTITQTHFSCDMASSLFVCTLWLLICPMMAWAKDDVKKQLVDEVGSLPFSDNPFFPKLVGNSGKIIRGHRDLLDGRLNKRAISISNSLKK